MNCISPISFLLQVCEKCGFSTVSKHKLRDHIRAKHEVEKHRKCPFCDYRSEQKQKIHFHIDIKHPESGQKNFFCDKCQMGFIYQQTCTHHMKFKCKLSGKEPFIYYVRVFFQTIYIPTHGKENKNFDLKTPNITKEF